MHKLPVIPIPDHLHNYVKEMKRDYSRTYGESVRDALQKAYERSERLKKRDK